MKYQVKWKSGIAHMIDPESNGRTTFCGKQTNMRDGWAIDEDATLTEFVEKVRPRCRACRENSQIVLAIGELTEHMDAS